MENLHSEDYGLYHSNIFLFYYEMEFNQFNYFYGDKYSNRRSKNNENYFRLFLLYINN